MRTVLLLAGAVALAGCAHQQHVVNETPPPKVAALPPVAAPTAIQHRQGSCTVDNDCGSGDLCLNNQCTPITPALTECRSFRVHFDFDRAVLHDQDKPALERIARCLRADNMFDVTVEGNCDERGTEEYNLHLGNRRARAVAKYLEDLGVSGQQLKTISYGKDRPLCTEHDEACWAQNRRDRLNPSVVASAR
jgi:peptidoglycan-associated lipoprotein